MSSTSTESLCSSIYDYVKENGRTYHRYKSGSESTNNRPPIHQHIATRLANALSDYMLPNDEVNSPNLLIRC